MQDVCVKRRVSKARLHNFENVPQQPHRPRAEAGHVHDIQLAMAMATPPVSASIEGWYLAVSRLRYGRSPIDLAKNEHVSYGIVDELVLLIHNYMCLAIHSHTIVLRDRGGNRESRCASVSLTED